MRNEGLAREVVNRIQNIRKDKDFDVTDKINIAVKQHDKLNNAIENNLIYICAETLADSLTLVEHIDEGDLIEVEEGISTTIAINRLN